MVELAAASGTLLGAPACALARSVIVGRQQVLREQKILPQPLGVYFLCLVGVKVANHVV